MKIILEDSEVEELRIEDSIKSLDNGIVILPKTRGPINLPTEQREIIANDALELGATRASEIHGVSQQTASKYANGNNLGDENAQTRVLDKRHEIRDLATTKLMQALSLIDPQDVEAKDLPRIAGTLSQIVDRLEGKDTKGNRVELHLYAPLQKKVSQYEIIDV